VTRGLESLSPGAVGRSSFIVGAGVGGAQVVGIVRELYLAGHVGLSGELDALLVSLGLTTLAAGLITSGASGALVPLYLEARAVNGMDDARRLSGTVIAWLAFAGLVISTAIAVFAPLLVAVSGPGLGPEGHERATLYLRLLTPVMFVTVVTTMMRVVCQAEEKFVFIAIATVTGPAATLATMLLLWQPLQLDALVVGSIVGSIATLAVLVGATARAAAVPIPRLRTDPRLTAMIRHAGPVTVSGGILEFRGIADRAIATLLGPGSVSALRYAMVLIQPLTQIGPAWSSVIYPRLVHLTLGGPAGSLAAWADRTLRSVVAIFVPVAALTAAVAPVAVFFAYGRGAFTSDDMSLTAATLAAYSPIIVTLMMLPILVGSLNARRQGGMLLLGGALNVILNIVLDVVFASWFGAPGIALATSVAEIFVVAVFIRSMARSGDRIDLRPFVRTLGRAALAIAPFAAVIGLLGWNRFGTADTLSAALALAAAAVVGVGGYVVVAARLGITEAQQILALIGERVLRIRPAAPPP
jgi:putative peptidoglycan lipid II flippase